MFVKLTILIVVTLLVSLAKRTIFPTLVVVSVGMSSIAIVYRRSVTWKMARISGWLILLRSAGGTTAIDSRSTGTAARIM